MNLKTTYRRICDSISYAGMEPDFNIYKRKRLIAFNRISIFSLVVAVVWFIYATAAEITNSRVGIFLNALPLFIQILTFALMRLKKQKLAIYISIVATPSVLALSSFYTLESSVILYILVFAFMPFFFHNKMSKIGLNYAYVMVMYSVAVYNIVSNSTTNLFTISPLLHAFLLAFIYLIFYTVKIQVNAYEKSLRLKNSIIDAKNDELSKLLLLKKQILTTISHDVVAPLGSLKSLVAGNYSDDFSKEEFAQMFPMVRQEISKTHDLFESLLKWSKTQANPLEASLTSVSISSIVDRAMAHVSFQANAKNISLFNYIEPGLTATINEDNLLVALRNLIANAIKYTAKNGKVCLDAGIDSGILKIVVKDNGVGMSSETMAKLFGDEKASKAGTIGESGNGLGLKIAEQLLKETKGRLYCASSVIGEGTTFAIELPVAALYQVKASVVANA
jgi:signal transduction histidine kinase